MVLMTGNVILTTMAHIWYAMNPPFHHLWDYTCPEEEIPMLEGKAIFLPAYAVFLRIKCETMLGHNSKHFNRYSDKR
jgi:hypothetical protein